MREEAPSHRSTSRAKPSCARGRPSGEHRWTVHVPEHGFAWIQAQAETPLHRASTCKCSGSVSTHRYCSCCGHCIPRECSSTELQDLSAKGTLPARRIRILGHSQQRPWATVNAEDWGGGAKPKAEIKESEVRGTMPRKRKR